MQVVRFCLLFARYIDTFKNQIKNINLIMNNNFKKNSDVNCSVGLKLIINTPNYMELLTPHIRVQYKFTQEKRLGSACHENFKKMRRKIIIIYYSLQK